MNSQLAEQPREVWIGDFVEHHEARVDGNSPGRLFDQHGIGVAADVTAFLIQRQRVAALQRMRAGAAIDQAVEDAWASPEVLSAIGDYVARTLKR